MRPIAIAILALPTLFGASQADPASEQLIRDAIAGIDSDPNWSAKSETITSDGNDTIVRGLTMTRSDPAMAVRFEAITATDLKARGGGGFVAAAIGIEGGTVSGPGFDIAFPSASGDAVGFPEFTGMEIGPAGPFTAIMTFYGQLARAELDAFRIPSTTITQTPADAGAGYTSITVTYRDLALSDMRDGVIGSLSAGSTTVASEGGPAPLDLELGPVSGSNFDLGTYVRRLLPANGDDAGPEWRQIAERIDYRNFRMTGPDGAAFAISNISIGDVTMRQATASIAGAIDAMGSMQQLDEDELREMMPALMEMYGLFRIGSTVIEGVAISAPDGGTGTLERLSFSDMSADGIDLVELSGLTGAGPGGSASIGNIRLDKIGFADASNLLRLMEMEERNRTPAEEAEMIQTAYDMIPTLDGLTIERMTLTTNGVTASLGSAKWTVDKRVESIPVAGSARVEDVIIPVDIAGPNPGALQLKAMGYDTLTIDMNGASEWDADKGIWRTFSNVDIADVAGLVLDFSFDGLGEDEIIAFYEGLLALGDNPPPEAVIALLDGIGLTSAKASLSDASIVERVIGMVAAQQGADPEAFRLQLQAALPFFLGMLGDPDLQSRVADAVSEFLNGGKRLTITASPVASVPIMAIAATGAASPNALIELLGADIESTPVE